MNESNNFIVVTHDKFSKVTTTTSVVNTSLGYSIELMGWTSGFILQLRLRHIKSENNESLLLDLRLDSAKGWVWLRDGQLSLDCDGEIINLKPTETLSSTDSEINSGSSTREELYYKLSKKELDKICSSTETDMRLTGSNIYFDFDQEQISRLKILCQQFYNNHFDKNKYTSSLSQNIKSNGACFIATATMGNYNHPTVIDLRIFRDQYLQKRDWGINFIKWYYEHGPKAAYLIEKSNLLKKLTFYLIVKPLHLATKILKY